ncbi:MAG: flavodoxin family protein, partial [Anaerolineae bacterium]|nr:flavodoxin family protein [Anaerolineae bacterium]
VELCRLRIAPCIACDGCFRSGVCVVEDGFQSVLPQLLEADAVVLASPLYFLGLSGWAKAFIDRCQCLWARRYILHQPLPPTSDGRPRRAAMRRAPSAATPGPSRRPTGWAGRSRANARGACPTRG